MRIAIGADHGGFDLKQRLLGRLQSAGHQVLDVGTSSREAVDYPVFARAVAEEIANGRAERGIVVDGAGIGSAMTANKVPGVRAALGYDISSARNGREHNDANVLTLGAGLIGASLAEQIVDVFLATECTEPRHLRRVAMIENVTALDEADLQRIVARLSQFIQASGPAAAPSSGGSPTTIDDLPSYIDHTLLRPNATRDEILKVCAEAREHGFFSVCVNPCWVGTVADALRGSKVVTCSVVGFPLGAATPAIKAAETRQAIRDGAREIDMVINVGALKAGEDDLVLRDIRAVVDACRDGSARCKVIIETALLSNDEKVRACELAKAARAHFVKTSTGFASGGATAEDVALMASVVRSAGMQVKASGGIRTLDDARRMIAAGATRIGASASVAMVREAIRA